MQFCTIFVIEIAFKFRENASFGIINCLLLVIGEWKMLGLITFLDPPRPDTKKTIEDARSYGVLVKMITGDHLLIAKETARVLELGNRVHDASGLPLLDPGIYPTGTLFKIMHTNEPNFILCYFFVVNELLFYDFHV